MQIRVPSRIRKYVSIFWKGARPAPIGAADPEAPLILFVHGFTGTAKETWKSWFAKIAADSELQSYKVDAFSYQTAIFELPVGIRLPSIDELAMGLATEISTKFEKSRRIVIVAHSMGGLIARQMLLDLAKRGGAIEKYSLLMYGTPNSGVVLATLASKAGIKPKQLDGMGLGNGFLTSLNDGWNERGIANRIHIRYVVGGGDQLVTPSSAGFLTGDARVEVAVELDHFSIVDPDQALPYPIFKRFIEQSGPELGDPLFTVYHLHDEPSYAVRKGVDLPLGKALNSSHLWLHGGSGVGKTSLLRRNALIGGWRLISVPLATAGSGATDVIANAFLSRAADALDQEAFESPESFIKGCRKVIGHGPICFLVEEIPFSSEEIHEEIAGWFAMVADLLDREASLRGRVRLAFTSLTTPIVTGSVQSRRITDRVVVMRAQDWSISELDDLACLAAKNADVELARDDIVAIIASSDGKPRHVKMVLRDLRTRPHANLTMSERIEEVSRG